MNWRRWLGFDPAVLDGGVVSVFQLSGGGELQVDVDQLQRSVSAARTPFPIRLDPTLNRIEQQFMNYNPDQRGNPLADKDNKRLHGLHLDDYQPRSHEHGVQRITVERAYPELPRWSAEDVYSRQRPSTMWVDYRNCSPLHDDGFYVLPPMRDAMADLVEHLCEVQVDLANRGLVAVEVSVEHEPTPSKPDGSGQGWNFAVHMVAVPQAVLDAEQAAFDEAKAAGKAENRTL